MDVFVLLFFFYLQQNCKVPFFINDIQGSWRVVNILATVNKWTQFIHMLPAIHALSGRDSTSPISGIGKKKVLNQVRGKIKSMEELIPEATDFGFSCYGIQNGLNMTEKR